MKPHRKAVLQILVSAGIVLLAFSLSLSLLQLFFPKQSSLPVEPTANSSVTPIVQSQKAVSYSTPQKIEIPKFSIKAPVGEVGIADNGDMAIDEDIAKAVWYKLGPKPGQTGSAVIAGHYGWKDGVKAAFSDIGKSRPGDSVIVYDQKGERLTFIVREIRTYNLNDDATEVFTSNDGKAHLNLITCEGAWDSSLQTFEDRLVVFTDLKTN